MTEMKYANKIGYSDIDPWEIIRFIGKKTVLIRSMKTVLTKTPSSTPGGFCAHFENHEQEWEITSDPNGHEIKIRLHKNGYYRNKYGSKFKLSDRPVKFYDFNF